jgi:NADH-quinone oxidoreductase subunit F
MFEPILTRNIGVADSEKIATYLARGGYEATRVALTQHTPAELIDMVKRSGLRGRGGAGFPAGTKWGFMPTDPAIPMRASRARSRIGRWSSGIRTR